MGLCGRSPWSFFFAPSHLFCPGWIFLMNLLQPLVGCTGVLLPTLKTMGSEVNLHAWICFCPCLQGCFEFLGWFLRAAISVLAVSRSEVKLARVVQSTSIAFYKLARAVAVSCWNHMCSSTFVSSLDALAPWYLVDCAVSCNFFSSCPAAE